MAKSLITLARAGDTAQIRARLAVDDDVTTLDRRGRSALSWASEKGFVAIVTALGDAGAPVNHPDDAGRTPLHLAAAAGRAEVVRELLRRGADVEARDGQKRPPVWEPARKGHVETVDLLLGVGATPTPTDATGTPLLWIVRGPDLFIRLVQAAEADGCLDPQAAFQAIGRHPHPEPALAVLRAGVDPDLRDDDGDTLLIAAARHGQAEVFAELLERGADATATGQNDRTPFRVALAFSHLEPGRDWSPRQRHGCERILALCHARGLAEAIELTDLDRSKLLALAGERPRAAHPRDPANG